MKRGRVFSLCVALLALGAIALAAIRFAQAQAPAPTAVPAANSADAAPPVALPETTGPAFSPSPDAPPAGTISPPAGSAPAALRAPGGGVLFAPAPPSADNVQFLLQPGGVPGASPPTTGLPAEGLPPGVGRGTISVPVYGGQGWSASYPVSAMGPYAAQAPRFAADPELAQLENDVINLARQAKGVPADEALRNQLKAALERAFDRRLALQAEEATALRERLAKVEAAIDKRKTLREKIVELRLQQLVTDPELEWDAALGRVSPAPPPTPYYVPTPTLPGSGFVPPAPARSPFKLLAPQSTPRAANVPDYHDASDKTSVDAPSSAPPGYAPGSTPPAGGSFSRLDGPGATALRDWLDQIGTMRNRLDAAREQVERSEVFLNNLRLREGATDNFLSPLVQVEAKQEADRRTTAERQLKNAIADVKKQIRLWELELEGAKLALDSAANTLGLVQQHYNAGTIPAREVESAKLSAGQAKIRVQQVEEILGAYKELLSNATAATVEKPAEPAATLKKQVRLWELELESARVSLAAAANEVTAIEVANSKSPGTFRPVEIDRKRLAADQAKIRVQQVEEILGAYQELLSNDTPSSSSRPVRNAADEDVEGELNRR